MADLPERDYRDIRVCFQARARRVGRPLLGFAMLPYSRDASRSRAAEAGIERLIWSRAPGRAPQYV